VAPRRGGSAAARPWEGAGPGWSSSRWRQGAAGDWSGWWPEDVLLAGLGRRLGGRCPKMAAPSLRLLWRNGGSDEYPDGVAQGARSAHARPQGTRRGRDARHPVLVSWAVGLGVARSITLASQASFSPFPIDSTRGRGHPQRVLLGALSLRAFFLLCSSSLGPKWHSPQRAVDRSCSGLGFRTVERWFSSANKCFV
jgi:hypothetical protein